MSSHFREQLESYLATLTIKADKVLDIGGLQLPIKGRTKDWDVHTYKIFDSIKTMKDRKADFVAEIDRTLDMHKDINELMDEWDVVFMLEVMEYVIDPVTAVTNVFDFLKPGGTAYISFPFLYPHHPPEGTDFLRFTEDGARELMRRAGFEDVEVFVRRAGPGRTTLRRFWDEERMRYRKDDLSHLDHLGYVFKGRRWA